VGCVQASGAVILFFFFFFFWFARHAIAVPCACASVRKTAPVCGVWGTCVQSVPDVACLVAYVNAISFVYVRACAYEVVEGVSR